MSVIKVFTVAHVPAELQQAWLQHLRDFDKAHPGCHFQVFADAPDVDSDDVIKMMVVHPDLTFQKFFERKKP